MNRVRDLKFLWTQQQNALRELPLASDDLSRASSVFAQANAIADSIDAVEQEIQQAPHMDATIDRQLLEKARQVAASKITTMTTAIDALGAQIERDETAATPKQQDAPDPATVTRIRERLDSEDPLLIAAAHLKAADEGDQATLTAIAGAHDVAFPNISRARKLNPAISREVARTTRFVGDPVARARAESRISLKQTLVTIRGDAQRLVGLDPIKQAAGRSLAERKTP